jgi:AcrR family transcriptional regulator
MWDLAAVQLRGGPSGPPRHVVAQVQRDRLLRGFAEVVAERGYEGATLRPLLKQTKISRVTYYELFGAKDELFRAAYKDATDHAMEIVESACAEPEDPRDRIRAGVRALGECCRTEPAAAKMCVVGGLAAGELGRSLREEAIERFARILEPQLRELFPQPSLVETRTRTMIGAVHEVMYTGISEGNLEELPDRMDQAASLQVMTD